MRNRFAGLLCVLGLSLVAVGCYNNPEISGRPPGSGTGAIHSKPQVGPGTVDGGSTAGTQPPARASHEEPASSTGTEKGVAGHTPEPAKH